MMGEAYSSETQLRDSLSCSTFLRLCDRKAETEQHCHSVQACMARSHIWRTVRTRSPSNDTTSKIHSVAKVRLTHKQYFPLHSLPNSYSTFTRRLRTAIRSEKRVVRRFRPSANVIQCTYTNLDTIACCTPRLYGIAYCC